MNEKKKKKAGWAAFWPQVTNIESARNAAMQGCWAAVLGAAITALFAIASFYGFQAVKGIDAYALVDAVLLLVLAWGIWKMSRTAALIALIYFVGSKLLIISENGIGNPIMMIIFGLFYINSVRGTFAYQNYKRGKTATITAND
jgi:hypothetical protein